MSSIEQLKSVNHHLKHAIDQISEGILIMEASLGGKSGPRIVFANRAASILTGYSPDELKGMALGQIYDPKEVDDLISRLPLVAQTTKTFKMEKNARLKSGELSPLRWTVSSVHDSNGASVNFTITLRQPDPVPNEIELELSVAKSRIESLILLTGGIAHDFRNVLQTIMSKLNLAKLDTPIRTEAWAHIDDAEQATKDARVLTRQILNYTKGHNSEAELVDLNALLIRTARLSTMGSNVECKLALPEDLWSVEGHGDQIQQVIHNLMINARQAMPNGGVIQAGAENIVLPEGNTFQLPPGPYTAISVRDKGCGIPADQLPKIFDTHFTTKDDGTGIGLATCRTIIERHQGIINVWSKPGVGSEFKVFLPSYRIEEAFVAEEPSNTPTKPAITVAHHSQTKIQTELRGMIPGHGRVLIVDDIDSVRFAAEQILKRLGYSTVSASSGEEAVSIYRQYANSPEPINAVLLDMTLPGGLTGGEVKKEILQFDHSARLIATSGYFDDETADSFQDEGWAAILPKPYAAEDLSHTLATAMQN